MDGNPAQTESQRLIGKRLYEDLLITLNDYSETLRIIMRGTDSDVEFVDAAERFARLTWLIRQINDLVIA